MRRARQLLLLILALAAAASATASSSPAATAPPPTLTLTPASATILVGSNHTVTASFNSASGGLTVTFTVTSGPNAGRSGSGITDATGKATFTYSSSVTGTDTLQASYTFPAGGPPLTSNTATATWSPLPKTDTKVAVSGPSFVRTGKPAAFTALVSNGGPDTATGVELHATVPAGTTLSSASSTVGGCSGGPAITCPIGTLAAGASATVTITLAPTANGIVTFTATVQGDYDTNSGNNSSTASTAVIPPNAVPPPPPPSSQRGTFNAVGTGSILVNGVARPADQQFQLNSGDVVDVGDGIITFTDSDGKYGSWAATRFTVQRTTSSVTVPALGVGAAVEGVSSKFLVQQPSTAGGVTTLTLVGGDFSVCNTPRSVAARSQKPVQQLWGSAKGSFTTKGRFAAATVRGTFWFVQDRCDGTLTQVVEGVVDVFDATLKKTVSVSAGQSYLALAPAGITPPASTPKQTAAQVLRRGLVWGRTTYKHKQLFVRYLTAHGATWQQFVKAYPKLAAALAKRK